MLSFWAKEKKNLNRIVVSFHPFPRDAGSAFPIYPKNLYNKSLRHLIIKCTSYTHIATLHCIVVPIVLTISQWFWKGKTQHETATKWENIELHDSDAMIRKEIYFFYICTHCFHFTLRAISVIVGSRIHSPLSKYGFLWKRNPVFRMKSNDSKIRNHLQTTK